MFEVVVGIPEPREKVARMSSREDDDSGVGGVTWVFLGAVVVNGGG